MKKIGEKLRNYGYNNPDFLKNVLTMLLIFCLIMSGYKASKIIKKEENIINPPEYDASYIDSDPTILTTKYPDLMNKYISSNIKIPINDEMIPQGITIMDDLILITSYDSLYQLNSQVDILSKTGRIIKNISLDTNSHVGAIVYDNVNKLIWLPDNDGVLNAYDSVEFLTKNKINARYKFFDISERLVDYEDNTRQSIDYLYTNGENLFIGNFSLNKKGIIKQYRINNTDKINLEYINEFNVPTKVQGITFHEYNGQEYMILSRSYNRYKPSSIEIYQYSENKKSYNTPVKKIILPPMLEQVVMDSNQLYSLFESNALKYSNCLEKVEYIGIIDFEQLISS